MAWPALTLCPPLAPAQGLDGTGRSVEHVATHPVSPDLKMTVAIIAIRISLSAVPR
ncbi:MAG: hypothetical protein ACLT0Y_01355 [Christensenellales bacterium]